MDRFDAMVAFARVVELTSFTKAAASLGLPKTTLSAQIGVLEKRLGVRLLNRTTRNVSVTDEGAAYYDRVVALLSQLEDTEAVVTASKAPPRGRLRIDMPPAMGRRIVKSRRFADFNFTKNGVRPDVKGSHVAAYNDIESALAGLGIAQLPLYILEEHLRAGRLLLLMDYAPESVPIHVLYPQTRMLSAKVKAFVDWTRDLFATTKHVSTPQRER